MVRCCRGCATWNAEGTAEGTAEDQSELDQHQGVGLQKDHVIVNGRRKKLEVCRLSTDLP